MAANDAKIKHISAMVVPCPIQPAPHSEPPSWEGPVLEFDPEPIAPAVPVKLTFPSAANLKIVVGVLTAESESYRVNTMNTSWVPESRADGIDVLYFTTLADSRQSPDIVKCNCTGGKEGLCCRTDCMMLTLLERYPDMHWYVRAMDDTWIVPDNLRAQLYGLDPTVPTIVGDFFTNQGNLQCHSLPVIDGYDEFGMCYPGGGGAAIVSAASVHKYAQDPQQRMSILCQHGTILDDVFFGEIFNKQLGGNIVADRGVTMRPAITFGDTNLRTCEVADLHENPDCNVLDRPEDLYCMDPIYMPASLHVGNEGERISGVTSAHQLVQQRGPDRLVLVVPAVRQGDESRGLCFLNDSMTGHVLSSAVPVEQKRPHYYVNVIGFSGGLQTIVAHMEENRRTIDLFVVVEDVVSPGTFAKYTTRPAIASFGIQVVYAGGAGASMMAATGHLAAQLILKQRGISLDTALIMHTYGSDIFAAEKIRTWQHTLDTNKLPALLQLQVRDVAIQRQLLCNDTAVHAYAIVVSAAASGDELPPPDKTMPILRHAGWRCKLCGGPHVALGTDIQDALATSKSLSNPLCITREVDDIPRIVQNRTWRFRWLQNPLAGVPHV
jgi:hypothetical protein